MAAGSRANENRCKIDFFSAHVQAAVFALITSSLLAGQTKGTVSLRSRLFEDGSNCRRLHFGLHGL